MEELSVKQSPQKIIKNTIDSDIIWTDAAFDFWLTFGGPPVKNNFWAFQVQPHAVIKYKPKDILVGELVTSIDFGFTANINESTAFRYFYEFILLAIKQFNIEMWKSGVPTDVHYSGDIDLESLYKKIEITYRSGTPN